MPPDKPPDGSDKSDPAELEDLNDENELGGNRDDKYICEVCGFPFQNCETRTDCCCDLEMLPDNCEACGLALDFTDERTTPWYCPANCWKCGDCGEIFRDSDACIECVLKWQRWRLQ